jgi:DNA-binding CsgD family transcriptional regulator
MKYRVLIFLGICLLTDTGILANYTTDSLFKILDKEIENRSFYLQQKKQRIESLSYILSKTPALQYTAQDEIYNELFNEYRSFNYDSAFACSIHLISNAYLSKNKTLIYNSRIKIGFTLLSAGLFKETLDTLKNINVKTLSDSVKLEYYFLIARTYFDMSDYVNDNYYTKLYNTIGNQQLDNAISLCRNNKNKFLSLAGLKHLRNGEMKEARNCYEEILRSKTLDGHQYAIEASSLGHIYKNDKEPELATQMLIRAAIADIQASIKETVAIRNLAEIVYKKGDINRAYNYVKVALDDAYFYGARHRKVQISDILPSIEDRQLEIVKHQRKTFFIYSLCITVLSLLVILFVIIIFRQLRVLKKAKKYLSEANKRLTEINRKLLEANLIKEEYIGQFFDTIIAYINRFDKIKINVNRKISAHQIEDIKDIIATIDIKQEREQFYNNFDSIFLKLFPDFVEVFNQFLKDDQLISNSKHMLTPEIRIYALLRLGITDNDKIARFLGYSLNTIYSYKTRIKNRLAIPIDEFEKILLSIKTI